MVFATVSLASALASPAGLEKIVPSAFAQTTVVALCKVLAFRPDNANAKGLGVERTAPFAMQSARLTAHCTAFAIRANASASMDMRESSAPCSDALMTATVDQMSPLAPVQLKTSPIATVCAIR